MDGLEISIFSKKYIISDNDEFRIDSEYYKNDYLDLYEKIENSPILDELVDMADLSTNGSFKTVSNIIHDNNEKSIPYIRSGNVGDTFINKNDLEFISKEAHKKLPKSTTKLNDIIMARKGKIGGASIITEEEVDYNCNENVIKLTIRDTTNLNPYYFMTFFNSKFGKKQVERLSTGNVQPWVSIFQIRKLKISILKNVFQNKIEEIVVKAHKKLQQSKQLYIESENILLEELGLKDWKPSEKSVEVKSFKESFGINGRLDAEYYQPKYDEIEEHIKRYISGYNTLDKYIFSYSTGYPYKSESYCNEGIPLIRITNINKGYLNIENATKIPLKDKFISEKDIAKENDILISMSGTIGNSCKIEKGIKALVNQRIMKITSQDYNPDVLTLMINSILVSYQLNRIGTGGVQTNISSKDILNVIIPTLLKEKQEEISKKIKESFALKEKSKQLLEIAKLGVEKAIEENEEEAMKWMESEVLKFETVRGV